MTDHVLVDYWGAAQAAFPTTCMMHADHPAVQFVTTCDFVYGWCGECASPLATRRQVFSPDQVLEVMATMFTNLDGESVQIGEPWRLSPYFSFYHYRLCMPLRGRLGWSELGMAYSISRHIGIVAFVRDPEYVQTRPETGHYMNTAVVLLHDGSLVHGCFHLFPDGNFSLS